MHQLEAVQKLYEAVCTRGYAHNEGDYNLIQDALLVEEHFYVMHVITAWRDEDVNAALALYNENLHDWRVDTIGQQDNKEWWGTINWPLGVDTEGNITRTTYSERAFDTPSLSVLWLKLILKGMATKIKFEEKHDERT